MKDKVLTLEGHHEATHISISPYYDDGYDLYNEYVREPGYYLAAMLECRTIEKGERGQSINLKRVCGRIAASLIREATEWSLKQLDRLEVSETMITGLIDKLFERNGMQRGNLIFHV